MHSLISPDTPPPLGKYVLAALKYMCNLMTTSYWVWGLGMAAMTLFTTCKPPLFGPFLLCRAGSDPIPSTSRILGTLALAFLEFVMGVQITVSGCHYVIHSQLPGTIVFWGRCQQFIKTTESLVDSKVRGYRHLQITERIQNSICRARILPVTLVAIPIMQILGGFALLMLYDTANVSQISLFVACYLDSTAFCLILLTAASYINTQSKGWIAQVKSEISGKKKNNYFKRVHKSFRPLRIEFGNNFVERLTPLVMQEFCISQTASLILLARL